MSRLIGPPLAPLLDKPCPVPVTLLRAETALANLADLAHGQHDMSMRFRQPVRTDSPNIIWVADIGSNAPSSRRREIGLGGFVTSECKVLIIDDHPITQSGLRLLFHTHGGYRVVGALDRGTTVSAFVQSQPVDLVILDLNMPDLRGINILAEIVGSRDMTVIVLTGETSYGEVDYALKLGARAVVSKADPPDQIILACDAALAGDIFISPHMREALGRLSESAVTLSSRQMAILHYLAQGESNKEIAYRLSIAQPTVSFHIAELRRKLEVPGNRKIVDRARELNIL